MIIQRLVLFQFIYSSIIIIIIIIVPFIVLYKSKTIVGQLGPKASVSEVVFANIQSHQEYKNEEGRSTEYPEGTVLANINRLVALIYFPQKASRIFQGTAGGHTLVYV